MFCDATDGAIQINRFTLERNGLSASRADVLWLPRGTVSRIIVSGRLPYGHDGKRLRTHDGVAFRTLAHEFGHLVVGLRDNYDEQRRFGSGCGIGPSIEAADLDEENHSIMQEYRSLCADPSHEPPTYQPDGPDRCNVDSECDAENGFRCYEFTDTASELSTPLVFDFLRGDYTGFPGPRAGTALLLDMVLGEELEPDIWTPATRTIEYINPAGESFEVAFEGYRSSATGDWALRAFLGETRLKWKVGKQPIGTEIELSFGATADCGNSLGNLSSSLIKNYYFLEQINGELDPQLTLLLPGWVNGQDRDVEIEVITTDLCEGRGGQSKVSIPPVNLNWQPDGIGRGAYFGSVGEGAPTSEPIYQQLRGCPDADVNSRWNRTTQRFESSDQYLYVHRLLSKRGYRAGDPEYRVLQGTHEDVGGSDWELMEYQLEYGWPAMVPSFEPIDISWASPVNHDDKLRSSTPVADNRAECDYPIEVDTSKIDVPDAVALVIDRSGSMGHEWKVGGRAQSRIEWARKGAAGFVRAADGQGIKLVVMEFAVDQEVLVWPSVLDSTAPLDKPGYIRPDEVAKRLAGIEPKGATAIHDAIDGAFKTLPAGHNNAVLLLTDGEDNSSTLPLEWVNADSAEFGIPVFVTPIGDFSGSRLQKLASDSGGELLAQVSPDEIPAAFFEMRAKLRGEQLSLHAASRLSQGDRDLPAEAHHRIRVEPAAERLLLMITPESSSQPTWDLDFRLRGPWGEVIEAHDADHVHTDPDGYYTLIIVPGPTAGTWTLDLEAPRSETPKTVPEAQLALAHIEHDGPRCLATTVVNRITSHADAVQIIAEASWGGLIDRGVSFTASVRRPDSTWVDVAMVQESDGLGYASFQDYSMDGGYEVRVRCEVAAAATYAVGEGAEQNDYRRERVAAGFDRIATTHFLLVTGQPPGLLPPHDDCDNDGLLNAREQPPGNENIDADGDGRIDACDSDSDNDDLPDSLEGLGDTDSDGVPDKHDRDSDDDGELDGADDDPRDPTAHPRHALGDFNGDGRKDRVWGEPEHDNHRGRVLVQYNGRSEPEAWQQGGPIIDSPEPGDKFGAAVAVGDFNGDGFDDLVVGAPTEALGGLEEVGAVHVLYGAPRGLTAEADQLWWGDSPGVRGKAETGDHFGARLATGDFNCDGFADLVISAPDEDIRTGGGLAVNAGAVHVLFGSAGGVSSVEDLWLQGDWGAGGSLVNGNRFGAELAVGDFDGDGCDELVIGVPHEDFAGVLDSGNVYVIRGAPEGPSAERGWTMLRGVVEDSPGVQDRFGQRLWVRDANGDGVDDLIVMARAIPAAWATRAFTGSLAAPRASVRRAAKGPAASAVTAMSVRSKATLALLGALGLGLILYARGSSTTPGEATLPGSAAVELAERSRAVEHRELSPQSLEGHEPGDWDALRSTDRVDQVERAVELALAEDAHRASRERAWRVLSAARADFFSSETGARRYLELEQALSVHRSPRDRP
ncbi:MAG: FG-GAP-like repeat-containing protein [Enhygromyxa sp.]